MNWQRVNIYGALALVGILITAYVWGKITGKGGRHDSRLTVIYFCGLFGALLGAKLAFLLAEGWYYHDNWIALVSGRSITGGLLGGYVAVEIAKKYLKYPRTTGDVFAIIAPIGLALGRIGCLSAGCCNGIICEQKWWALVDGDGLARWPAVPIELLFNLVFLAWALPATRFRWQIGNRFHIYLIAYGLFRFGHEFLRDNPRLIGAFGGYHFLALCILLFGAVRFAQRRNSDGNSPVAAPRTSGITNTLPT